MSSDVPRLRRDEAAERLPLEAAEAVTVDLADIGQLVVPEDPPEQVTRLLLADYELSLIGEGANMSAEAAAAVEAPVAPPEPRRRSAVRAYFAELREAFERQFAAQYTVMAGSTPVKIRLQRNGLMAIPGVCGVMLVYGVASLTAAVTSFVEVAWRRWLSKPCGFDWREAAAAAQSAGLRLVNFVPKRTAAQPAA